MDHVGLMPIDDLQVLVGLEQGDIGKIVQVKVPSGDHVLGMVCGDRDPTGNIQVVYLTGPLIGSFHLTVDGYPAPPSTAISVGPAVRIVIEVPYIERARELESGFAYALSFPNQPTLLVTPIERVKGHGHFNFIVLSGSRRGEYVPGGSRHLLGAFKVIGSEFTIYNEA